MCVCVRLSGRLWKKHIILCSNLGWHCHISFILFPFSSGCSRTWHTEMKHTFIVEWGRLNKKGQRERLVTLGMSLGCRFRILHRWLLWGCCILMKARPEVTYVVIYGLKTIWINEETLESQLFHTEDVAQPSCFSIAFILQIFCTHPPLNLNHGI